MGANDKPVNDLPPGFQLEQDGDLPGGFHLEAERPQAMFSKDKPYYGLLDVLKDEAINGHAPNAIEPTNAAQIMAPMMMYGEGAAQGIRGGMGLLNSAIAASPTAARVVGGAATGIGGLLGYHGGRSALQKLGLVGH